MSDIPKPTPIDSLDQVQAGDERLLTLCAVLRNQRLGKTSKGDPFLDIELADSTRSVKGKVWSDAGEALAIGQELPVGSVVKVLCHAESYRGVLQLRIRKLKTCAEDEADYDADVLFGKGWELVSDIRCKTLVFDIETVPAFERRQLPTTVAESLAKWAERTDSDDAKVMGLSPFFGKCISIAVGDGIELNTPRFFGSRTSTRFPSMASSRVCSRQTGTDNRVRQRLVPRLNTPV